MHVAIVGCGQLARMMALAGWNMGLEFTFLAERDETTRSVEGLGRIVRRDPADSPAELYAALGEPDVVTVEKEHVDHRRPPWAIRLSFDRSVNAGFERFCVKSRRVLMLIRGVCWR